MNETEGLFNLNEEPKNNVRDWMEVDTDEQEYLERLSNFGEGYYDFSTFTEIFGQSGETGLAGA